MINMLRKNRNIIIVFIMFIISIILLETKSLAAGSFSVSSDKTNLNVGDTTTLRVKVTNCEGLFTFSSSDSSIISISKTQDWIGDKSDTCSIVLTAKKAGTAKIVVTAKEVGDTDFNDVTGSKPISITVSEPVKEEPKTETPKTETPKTETPTTPAKSSDASLKSITVGGKTYSNPSTSITASSVSADTSSIKISAQTNDSKAKVTGTGTKELVTGTNKFTLKVTAEDGSTKSYTIKITKLAEEKTTPNIVEEKTPENQKQEEIVEPELRLSSLVVQDTELIPKFEAEVFEYSVYITNINEIKIDAVANIEGANVEITGNTNLIEGENVVLIKLTKDDKLTEYKITANKAGLSSIQENIKPINVDKTPKTSKNKIDFVGQIKDWWNKSGLLTILYAGILGLLSFSIAFAVTIYKYSKPARETSKQKESNI